MTVLSIMDRDGWDQCTDIIIVFDDAKRTATWIPRDLWVPEIKDRINRAFASGKHKLLTESLGRLGFPCDKSICVTPIAISQLISTVNVLVPVKERMEFIYPLHREGWTEHGYRMVHFSPPNEHLVGDRVHEWIGARKTVPEKPFSDLHRIERQKTLLLRLLEIGFRFDLALINIGGVSFSHPDDWGCLSHIQPSWSMATFGDGLLENVLIDQKWVMVIK